MFFKSNTNDYSEVKAAIDGEIIALTAVESPIFAGKVVGDGVAIIPSSNQAVAPISGTVSFIGDKHYSYGITGYDGTEVLLHIGLNTSELEGQGLVPQVKKGDQVKQGDLICSFDLELFKSKGLDITTPLIITSGSLNNIKRMVFSLGQAKAGETTCISYTTK